MSLDPKETYCTVAEADTYWENNPGGESWSEATGPQKEAALRQATQFVDKQYTWIGHHPGSVSQLLSWPRLNAMDKEGRLRTGIPQEVKDATAYMADQVLQQGLLPPQKRGGAIKTVTAGPVSVDYEENASSLTRYDYPTMLLKSLTKGGRGSRPLKKG